ncbi:MAG TPA: hypothetical protein VL382_07210 [Terriglobales bacterium]|jgi:hypothetical protein|nr:hypothetical protein [Terriglobales bacterium]
MKRPIVQFDVDGVLADFAGGYKRLWSKIHNQPFPIHLNKWDDLWDAAVWEEIKTSPSFWVDLDPLVVSATFRHIRDIADTGDVYYVTGRVGRYAKWQTEQWLRMHGVIDPTVIVSHKKGEIAAAISATHAIDDKAGNAVFVAYHSPKTASFVLDAPYNQFDHNVLGSKVARVYGVNEFLDAVEAA